MTGLPWYKCDPARFNDGMIGLSRSERGVYATVLNAIYIEGGPVKDEPLYWTSVFRCSEAAWLKDRGALIAKGKLFLAPTEHGQPGLMNRKAGEELDIQKIVRATKSESGRKGGLAKGQKQKSKQRAKQPLADAKRVLSKTKQIEREIYPRPSQGGADQTGGVVVLGPGARR